MTIDDLMYNKIKLLSYWYEMKTAKTHNPNQSDALQTRQKEVKNNGMKIIADCHNKRDIKAFTRCHFIHYSQPRKIKKSFNFYSF